MSQTTLTKLYDLIKTNQIDEAKKLITSFVFYCTDGTKMTGYLIYNDINQSYIFSTKKNLKEFFPGDLNNDEYVYQNRLPKNKAFNLYKFLDSTAFMSDIHYITLDYLVKDNTFIEIEKINGNNVNKKMLNMKKSLPFCESVLDSIDINDYKKEIDIINNHIYEVLTSKQKGQYEYFLNFLSASARGFKTRTSIYMQTPEGVGKGILMSFLSKMLGNRFFKSSSTETVTQYTIPFEGRTLINIDELTGSSDKSYKTIQDKLKILITEEVFDCRTMYQAVYSQKNTFNIIITTNNNSIELSINNSRRYICMDVSAHRKGDYAYFKKLKMNMDKPNVEKAYYKFLLERFENNKIDQFNFEQKPFSEQEIFKLTAAMPPLLRYIKEKFLLNGKGVYIECQKLMKNYNEHVKRNTAMVVLNKELNERLGLEKKRVRIDGARKYIYDIDYKSLLEIYKVNKWLVKDEIDETEDDDDLEEETNDTKSIDTESSSIIESQKLHLIEADELNKEKDKIIKKLMKQNKEMTESLKTLEDHKTKTTISEDTIIKTETFKTLQKDINEEPLQFKDMKVKQLRDYCKENKIDVKGMKKKDIINCLEKLEEIDECLSVDSNVSEEFENDDIEEAINKNTINTVSLDDLEIEI